jgi:hypothetical protein
MMPGADVPGPDNATVDVLYQMVTASRARSLAVVGLAKNAGKTSVVNALMANCSCRFGLTSLGLDGERVDHLTGLAKPRITPPEGTLIATTTGSLQRSRYHMTILEELPFVTPLGPVVIGRASGEGEVEISGPTTLAELRHAIDRVLARGADQVIVDGAIDRLGSASPRVSDGLLVATGGVVGDTLSDVVETTTETLDLLSLPQASPTTREALDPHLKRETRMVAVDAHGGGVPLSSQTAIGEGISTAREVTRLRAETLYVSGALTQVFLDDLIRVLPPQRALRVVVRDPTVLVMPASTVARCRLRDITIEVLTPLNLLALTVNPFRLPRPYPPAAFFAAFADAVGTRVPIFDVVNGHAAVPYAPAAAWPLSSERG